jgi:hypothetical protein
MTGFGRFTKWVAGSATAALVLTAGGMSAYAGEAAVDASAEEVLQVTSAAVSAANQDIALETFVPASEGFAAVDGSVEVVGGTVKAAVGAGTEITLQLPVDPAAQPEVTSEGTLVFPGQSPDLHTEVQNVEGGAARVLTVAQESYSDTPVHQYSYGVGLPEGARLLKLPTGEIAISQDTSKVVDDVTAAEVAAVELTSVLPNPAEVNAEELAAGSAPAEVIGAAIDGVPATEAIVGVFQAPWAVDAVGNSLPTRLEVQGQELVQVVDTSAAVFPVVSDPLPLVAIALAAAARALAPHAIRAFATQTIRAGAAYTTRGGYWSFNAFKSAVGSPRANYQWHHIVEQSNIAKKGWDARAIHNSNNLVQIPTAVHQKCVNSWMARTGVRSFGVSAASSQTMRQWVHSQSFSKQHQIGVALLRHCGVLL